MRQNDFIFDIDGKKIGIARSKCNNDPDMITSEDEYISFGTNLGLGQSVSVSSCNHTNDQINNFMSSEITFLHEKFPKVEHESLPFYKRESVINALQTFIGVILLCCVVFICIFIKEGYNYVKKNLGRQDLS